MAADGSVVIEITGDDEKLQKKLHSLGSIATSALKGVTTAVAGATAAVAGLAGAAAKVGSDFEASLAATSTMFGDVAVDTAGLTDQILELSSATGMAASDLSSSLYNALSAGIPVTEDMGEAMDYMESCTKLAAAGFTDVDTAVTATAKVINAYGMDVSEVDKVQRIMLQTQNKGITTVNELGATLAQVTPTAAAMGVSFDQVGAALATMTAQGTPTAQATTQLNSLIAELGKSGTQAAVALTEAVSGTEYAGKSFSDLMTAGVPLNEVLDLMGEYAERNGLSMIDLFSSIEAGKSALAMAGDQSAKYAANLAAMSTEADLVGDAYSKVTDTLEHKVDVLKQGVSNLGIAVYQDMQEPLKAAADTASDWLGDVTAAFKSGGLVAAVGSLGTVLADAAAKVTTATPTMIDAGVTLVQNLISGLTQSMPAIATSAGEVVTTMVQGIITTLPMLVDPAMQMIAGLVTGIGTALPTLIPAAVEAVITVATALVDNIPTLIDAALAMMQGLLDGLLAAIPVLLEAVPQIIADLLEALLSHIPTIVETGITLLTSLVNDLPTIIDKIVEAIPKIIGNIITAVGNHIPDIIKAGFELFIALIDNLPGIIKTIVTAVPDIVCAIVDGFADHAGDIIDIGKNIIRGVWDGIKSMGSWIGDKVGGFFGGIVGGVKDLLGIHSPSRVFAEIGRYTLEGYAVGIDREKGRTAHEVTSSAAKIHNALTDELGGSIAADFAVNGRAAVEAEAQRVSALSASAAPAPQVVREVQSHTRTVERVARLEGSGVTGELIRILGLKLAEEKARTGETLEGVLT